jgi:hypothetical protein
MGKAGRYSSIKVGMVITLASPSDWDGGVKESPRLRNRAEYG